MSLQSLLLENWPDSLYYLSNIHSVQTYYPISTVKKSVVILSHFDELFFCSWTSRMYAICIVYYYVLHCYKFITYGNTASCLSNYYCGTLEPTQNDDPVTLAVCRVKIAKTMAEVMISSPTLPTQSIYNYVL